jgi:uncharacterized membrane protein
MIELSLSNIVSKAWNLFKQNASDLIVVLFVYMVISGLLSFAEEMTAGSMWYISLSASIIKIIASLVLSLGLTRAFLNVVDGDKSDVNTLFQHRDAKLILHYVIGSIIGTIVIFVGLILLIIPGIYIIARLQFFTLVLLEQEEPNFMDALKESWDMTANHVWDLVGIGIVSIIIILAGFLALIVGLFVAIPVVGLMSSIVYRLLQTKQLS